MVAIARYYDRFGRVVDQIWSDYGGRVARMKGAEVVWHWLCQCFGLP